MVYLRKCIKCGLEAHTKEELEKFTTHSNSTYGYANICRKCKTDYQRRWSKGHRDGPNYTRSKPRRLKQGAKDNISYRKRTRQKFLELYGNECSCCGEKHVEFLTLDHIQGDGAQERKRLGGNYALYLYAIKLFNSNKEEALKQHRILCWNCNCSIGVYGYCPHNKN